MDIRKIAPLVLILAGSAFAITFPSSCPTGTQGTAYAGCSLAASGGTGPYTYMWSRAAGLVGLPEGLTLNASTGAITGTPTGSGIYVTTFTVTDSASGTLTQTVSIPINGYNPIGRLFPSDSIFHGVNIAGLPVDTSPAAPALQANIHIVFGQYVASDGGMPVSYVSTGAPNIAVSCPGPTCYQNPVTSGPFSSTTPIEATQNDSSATTYIGDGHALVVQGGPTTGHLYESYNSQYIPGNNTWQDVSNFAWDLSAYSVVNGAGSADAAGLPIAPFLADYDQVTSSGGQKTPIRFTRSEAHTLNYHVWPATVQSGGGACSGGYVDPTFNQLLLQSNPPTTCSTFRTAFGEIYRIKASVVASPPAACLTNFSTNPQAASLFLTLANYGMIMADNGIDSGLGGRADARWSDADLNCLTNLPGSAFEPVNVSSIIRSQSSAQVVSLVAGTGISGAVVISGATVIP